LDKETQLPHRPDSPAPTPLSTKSSRAAKPTTTSAQAALTRSQQAARPEGHHLVRQLVPRAASVCVLRAAAASMVCSLLILSDAEWVTISFLLNYPRHQRGASVRFRGLVLGMGEDAFWLSGLKPCSTSLVLAWVTGVEPRIVQRICSHDQAVCARDVGTEFSALVPRAWMCRGCLRGQTATNAHVDD
jgi:hypothetical protein